MLFFLEKALFIMIFFRILSGSVEIFAAYLMFRFNDIEKAILINSSLALIGPFIFILTTIVGLFGIADKISFQKFIFILLGVCLIMFGVLKAD